MMSKTISPMLKPTAEEKAAILDISAQCIRDLAQEISLQLPGTYKDMLCRDMMFLVHYRNSTLNLEVQ